MSDRMSRGVIERVLSDPKAAPIIGLVIAVVLGMAAFFFRFAGPFISALAGFILPLSLHFSYWMKSESEKRAKDFEILQKDIEALTKRWAQNTDLIANQRMTAAFEIIPKNFAEATKHDANIWRSLVATTRADPFPFIYAKLVNLVVGTIGPASANEADVFKDVSGLTINERRNHLEASVIFWTALAQYIRLRKGIEKFDRTTDVFVTHFFNPKYWRERTLIREITICGGI